MRFKLTFVLLLANLVVFFVLWRLDKPAPLVPKAAGPVARDFTPDDILIHLTTADHAGKETREFVRDANGKWNIVQPFKWPADDFAVTDIYTNLQLLDVGANITPDQLNSQSYKDFGLDQPVLDVTLADHSHKQTLIVGLPTARGGNVYAMNPDDKIVRVIAQSALASLFAPMGQLRDQNIFSTKFFEAKSLSVWSPKLVKFVKDGDVWMLDTPLRRPADTAKLNSVITQLGDLKVARFLAPAEADQARPGLANPTLMIELEGESSQTLHLGGDAPVVAGAQPEIYAQMDGSDVIFTLQKSEMLTKLLPQAQDLLRERQFLDFDPAAVIGLDISSPDGEVHLDRLESRAWQVRNEDSSGAPHPFDADTGIVQGLLGSLANLTAENFASDAPSDLKPFGLDAPLRKVVLRTDKALTLDVGRHSDTPADSQSFHYYAKIEGADTVYEIDGETLNEIDPRPLYYRDRVFESLPATAQITFLKLTRIADNQDIFSDVLPANTTWEDYLHGDANAIRRSALLDVRNFVKRFVVAQYRQAAFSDDYQIPTSPTTPPIDVPWRYRLDAGVQIPVAASTPVQSKTLSFYFSDPLPGLQVGGAKEPAPGAVFDLAQYLIGDLGVLLDEASRPAAVQQTLDQLTQPINPIPAPATAAPAPVEPASAAPPPAATAPAVPAPLAAPLPAAPAGSTPATPAPPATSFAAPVRLSPNFFIPDNS
jgi:hypothetical protein